MIQTYKYNYLNREKKDKIEKAMIDMMEKKLNICLSN